MLQQPALARSSPGHETTRACSRTVPSLQILSVPRRSDAPELLDSPTLYVRELGSNLRDIRRLNRWFGGTYLALKCVERALDGETSGRVLDVATGSADIPRALKNWSEQRGIALDIVASDLSENVLREARHQLIGTDVRVARADAMALPWRDGQFDIVLCCLALHHFREREAVAMLREMRRVAARAVIVIDLRRSYVGWAATWLATRLLTGNRLTKHDGPLSVLRSYTPSELASLARQAGLTEARVQTHRFFRQSLCAETRSGRENA